ncbi:MAG: hypothetical protein QNJ35_17735 [Paracoccaceae bacterium]|nr:hypothetical protein [Paracoccaceae bacterium]
MMLIEGFEPDELVSQEDIKRFAVTGQPIVISVGDAEVLAEFSTQANVLKVKLAVVERGGEGVLPVLIDVIERVALKQKYAAIEWIALARDCATPNPKLMKVLEKLGFEVRTDDVGGEFYWQRRSINDTLMRRRAT